MGDDPRNTPQVSVQTVTAPPEYLASTTMPEAVLKLFQLTRFLWGLNTEDM